MLIEAASEAEQKDPFGQKGHKVCQFSIVNTVASLGLYAAVESLHSLLGWSWVLFNVLSSVPSVRRAVGAQKKGASYPGLEGNVLT